jgi:hypothetical protein
MVRLSSGVDFVELRCHEIGKEPGMSEGDLRLGVSVCSGFFSGAYDEIWIAQLDWRQFIQSLTNLERDRRGKASLVAMSPDEFELHIEIVGAAGHIVAYGFLSNYSWRRPVPIARLSRVEFGFSLDPSLPRILLEEFIALSNLVG